jgi:hypothetical protein
LIWEKEPSENNQGGNSEKFTSYPVSFLPNEVARKGPGRANAEEPVSFRVFEYYADDIE